MTVSYTPGFNPSAWVDNHDRVKASGPNGFNERFADITQEFQDISQVVGTIGQALDSLGQQVAAAVTVTLSPTMLPFRPGTPEWSPVLWGVLIGASPQGSYAEKDQSQASAKGVLPLDLPRGAGLSKLAVRGEAVAGGSVTTELVRELRTAPFTADRLLGPLPGFFNPTDIPSTPAFTSDTHTFYIIATGTGAGAAEVHLRGFEISYLPPTI
jgi:hypothetical protein